MRKVFDHPVKGREETWQLLSLNEAASWFLILQLSFAAETGWDQAASQGIFLRELSEEITEELVI